MNEASSRLARQDKVSLMPSCRLQAEGEGLALLYPEGLARLNDTAADILSRLAAAGPITVADLVAALERDFAGADLAADVHDFLEIARAQSWISVSQS